METRATDSPGRRVLLITAAYLVASALGYAAANRFLTVDGVAVWYPPAAFSLVYLTKVGPRGAPVVLASRLVAGRLLMGPEFALGNEVVTSFLVVGAYTLAAQWLRTRRLGDIDPARAVGELVAGVGFAAGLAATAAIGYDVVFNALAWHRYAGNVASFWLGDTTAALAIAPLMLLPLARLDREQHPARLTPGARAEASVVAVALALAAVVSVLPDPSSAHFYPIFVPLIWTALRRGLPGAAVVVAASSVLLPALELAGGATADDMSAMQLFLVVLSVTGLFIGAAESRRRSAGAALTAVERQVREEKLELARVEETQRASLDALEQGVLLSSMWGEIKLLNRSGSEMLGYTRDELTRLCQSGGWLTYDEHGELLALQERPIGHTMATGEAVKDRIIVWHKADGTPITLRVATEPVHDRNGILAGVVTAFADITGQREAQRASEQADLRFRSAFEHAPYGVELAAPEAVIDVNPMMIEISGRTREELMVHGLAPFIHPDDALRLLAELGESQGRGERVFSTEARILRPDGTHRWVRGTIVSPEGSEGITRIVHVDDITAKREALEALQASQARLEQQAFHDTLTGLPNRAMLLRRLDGAEHSAERNGPLTGLLFVDLDNFKLVNDTLGHDVGDRLLVAVSERLEQVARSDDLVARFGGDEFVVLARGLHTEGDAVEIAEMIGTAMKQPFTIDGNVLTLSASVGIALEDGSPTATMLRDADTALYRAKERGRGRHEVFDDSLRVAAVQRVAAESLLRRALDADELQVHYQPIVDLRTGRTLHTEALLRVPGPDGELQGPAEFIRIAEESGLIVAIGAGVLDAACAALRGWRATGADAPDRIAVNVSPRELASAGFAPRVERILALHGLSPHDLVLELTESALIHSDRETERTIEHLHRSGVSLAIDDFGTGYSSLAYLKRFPIDVVKIDRSFVDGLGTDPNDTEIVRAIISLSRSLGVFVIAEGVETAEQLHDLTILGCDAIQGYFVSRPVPADRLLGAGLRAPGRPFATVED